MDELKKLISDFLSSQKVLISLLGKQSEKVSETCLRIARSWSGFPYGDNVYYYYHDFLTPPAGYSFSVEWGSVNGVPDGWVQLRGEEVKNEIEKNAGKNFSLKEYNKKTDELLVIANDLKESVLLEISVFDFNDKLEKEKKVYQLIEEFDLGDVKQIMVDYINNHHVMGSFVSRDSEALMKGRSIPAHVTTAASVHATREILGNINNFISLVDKFIKLIDKKATSGLLQYNNNDSTYTGSEKLEKILNKFHGVAQQLKPRHSSRETIKIEDEYDVQDLLHALLKIEFDDIRPEEYTPSYAGSSTRMDFLLKQEKIVIEVKIAGDKLKDPELGKQLILDIAHYQVHPDCKTLYCFIYDPKSVLTKKASLVNDLEKTHGDLDVRIFIRPLG